MNHKLSLFDPELVRDRHTFSLAALFRGMTLIGLAFGWYSALPTVPPETLALVLLATAATFAVVVGYRRRGPTLPRLVAGTCFFGNGCIVSVWTAFVAVVIQQTPQSMNEGLGEFLALLVVIASLPCVVLILFFMFRAWVWTANDRLICESTLGPSDLAGDLGASDKEKPPKIRESLVA